MSYLFRERIQIDSASLFRLTMSFTRGWLYYYKTRRYARRGGKSRSATVHFAAQPGDYVNVAHGGATDALADYRTSGSSFTASGYAYTLIPI